MVEFLSVLTRRWRLIAAFAVVGVAIAATITYTVTPSYRAEAQLFVALANGDGSDDTSQAVGLAQGQLFAANRVKSYPDLADSPLVLDPVIKELGLSLDASQLADRVSATVPTNTVLLDVDVDDPSAQASADIANAVAERLSVIIEDLDRVRQNETSPVRVSVVRPAVPPSSPRTPIPLLYLAIGLVAGLGLGLAAASIREALDTTVKNEADVEEATGLATLAAVPSNPDISSSPVLAAEVASGRAWSESYRKLRTNIGFLDPDQPPRVLLVTSALAGEGKTVTAANLAASLAQGGRSVVLVDADLRRPGVAKLVGLVGDVGVTTVIAGKASLAEVIQDCSGFSVITSGPIPPNPSELLGSQSFRALVEALRGEFEHVVIDTPPLIAVTDAAVASTAADAVLVVCRAKRTRRPDLLKALHQLRAVDANIAGVVLNQMPSKGDDYDYSYRPASRRRGTADA